MGTVVLSHEGGVVGWLIKLRDKIPKWFSDFRPSFIEGVTPILSLIS